MSALKDISNVLYSEYYHKAMLNMDLSKEVDFLHLVMIEIKKEGYIKYDRRRKKKIEELKDEWIKEYSKIQPNENKNLLDGIGFKKTIELEKNTKN